MDFKVQLLTRFIAYFLFVISCREQQQDPVSISSVRKLHNQITSGILESQNQRTRKTLQTKQYYAVNTLTYAKSDRKSLNLWRILNGCSKEKDVGMAARR